MIKNFLNPEGHQNPVISSKVTAILQKGWILPIGRAASGRVCACSLRSRLVSLVIRFSNMYDLLGVAKKMCCTKGDKICYLTQFEIEHRSCCQSIANFRFFSCGGQNNFTGCHSFCMCLVWHLQNFFKKIEKINPVVFLHWQTEIRTCATFLSFLAAQSSSRSLVVCRLVGWSVGPSVTFVK